MRVGITAVGAAAVAFALLRDWIQVDVPAPGIGRNQLLLLIGGLLLMAAGFVVPDSHFRRFVVRPLLVTGSIYLPLLVCNAFMAARAPVWKDPGVSLRNLYRPDPVTGYRLAPNYHGYYDDGLVRVEYRTNSFGDRDDEPRETSGRRVLLIGDSYTFGSRLGEGDRVDVQMERLSDGRIDAYNLGVAGYGPPQILEHLRRCDWYRGSDAVYLFYNNDLTDQELDITVMTVFDGYKVRRCKLDGVPFTEAEYRIEIERILHPPPRAVLAPILDLRHLGLLLERLAKAPTPLEKQLLRIGPHATYLGVENVEKAVSYTLAMRTVAAERGMRFHVLIVPWLGETAQRRYAPIVTDYIGRMRGHGVDVIEMLERLSPDDYFREEGHFNPAGARRTAEAIIRGLADAP